MHPAQRLYFLMSLLFLSAMNMFPQAVVSAYMDMGQNNVSNGLYIKTAGLANYQYGKYRIGAGFQLDLKSPNENIFSGLNLNASREFLIKDFPLEIQGFYTLTPFSDISRETNWGLILSIQPKHFIIRIGTNFRTYALNKKAISNYEIDADTKIKENWNLMYSFSYYLKSFANLWNVGLSLTNFDHFIINQETNPIFNINAWYKPTIPFKLFIETWYKSSGAFNLSVNNFGFFVRTGIIWNIQ